MRKFGKRQASAELFLGIGTDEKMPPKADKRRLEKLRQSRRELLELFTAVEQDDIGKVRSILEGGEVDVNGYAL